MTPSPAPKSGRNRTQATAMSNADELSAMPTAATPTPAPTSEEAKPPSSGT